MPSEDKVVFQRQSPPVWQQTLAVAMRVINVQLNGAMGIAMSDFAICLMALTLCAIGLQVRVGSSSRCYFSILLIHTLALNGPLQSHSCSCSIMRPILSKLPFNHHTTSY